MNTSEADFLAVTELAGDEVSQEQVQRIYNRYRWAGHYCADKDVLEAACGTGQGLGYLAKISRSVIGGDYSQPILDIARRHYGDHVDLRQFDAQAMPFPGGSLDVILLFEAIYYLPSAERFVQECWRVLRPGGKVLIVTANKDLYDFNPSPHSFVYYGVTELVGLLTGNGFVAEFFGDTPVDKLSWRQKVLRPIKKAVVASGLMPRTMAGKKLLKRLVFGNLVKMPAEIADGMMPYSPPSRIDHGMPDIRHKVLYCAATKI